MSGGWAGGRVGGESGTRCLGMWQRGEGRSGRGGHGEDGGGGPWSAAVGHAGCACACACACAWRPCRAATACAPPGLPPTPLLADPHNISGPGANMLPPRRLAPDGVPTPPDTVHLQMLFRASIPHLGQTLDALLAANQSAHPAVVIMGSGALAAFLSWSSGLAATAAPERAGSLLRVMHGRCCCCCCCCCCAARRCSKATRCCPACPIPNAASPVPATA